MPPRCPLCASAQITVVISRHRRGFCSNCGGARWVQDGSEQHTIKRIQQPARTAPPPAID
jgi:hypothetical protein